MKEDIRGKGGKMATESSIKVTCDGCGQSRTLVHGQSKREELAPWYAIELDVKFQTIGQGDRGPGTVIDACSADCVSKAVAKWLPPLPERLPPR